MPRVSRKTSPKTEVVPRAKFWLELDGQYVFGRGISEILKAVAQTGSIKAAADRVGKSYRFVWARVKQTEQSLGASLVHTQIGGSGTHRSELTELARDLVRDFDALRERALALVRREFTQGVAATLRRHRAN
jgi:molybdate transport system regulatory protein